MYTGLCGMVSPDQRHHQGLAARVEALFLANDLQPPAEEVRQRHIKSITLPALGCGNGGLDWGEVLPAIRSALADLTDVRLFVYPPND